MQDHGGWVPETQEFHLVAKLDEGPQETMGIPILIQGSQNGWRAPRPDTQPQL